jgi:FkbM family methyltransferase
LKRIVRLVPKVLRLLCRRRYRRALRHGVGAAVEHEHLLRSLDRLGIGLVLDVGANVGQFTLATREYLPQAAVIAFEPLPGAAARFRAVHGADPSVELIEAAVAPEAGLAPMNVSKAADSSSLLPIGAAQVSQFPGTGLSHVQTVRRIRLEDAVPLERFCVPTLLKIDVQGFELGVLQGSERCLGSIALIYVECSFVEFYEGQALADEVIDWLRPRGFRLHGFGTLTPGSAGVAVQCDLLFVRTAAPARPPGVGVTPV